MNNLDIFRKVTVLFKFEKSASEIARQTTLGQMDFSRFFKMRCYPMEELGGNECSGCPVFIYLSLKKIGFGP